VLLQDVSTGCHHEVTSVNSWNVKYRSSFHLH